ncbi:pyridoxal-phosphate dependent enzyme [Corynebacterium pilosum]|uniref:Cysteine synthase n=1 Tax=Corynebacterium pilosum TaxID=35756 RepID=A0A376CPT4_9CORY|nr:pyridoxal-phosphate dependent enzyme [Corynebacterium pilosum]STC70313.1 cysteine synthase [Corynebacterium pilosum]
MSYSSGETLPDLLGNTPLVRFDRFAASHRPPGVRLWAKLESFNPGGSAKDRTAHAIVTDAIQRGIVSAGTTVVESSSGNLGVALAREAATASWTFHCVVDPKANRSTVSYMRALGATVHEVTEPDAATGDWLTARRTKVAELIDDIPDAVTLDQYSNRAALSAHCDGTMREIVDTLRTAPDYLVVAVSTTGTIGGCLRYIASHGLDTQVVAVDAVGSILFCGLRGTRHLPGFGAGMVPELSRGLAPHRIIRVPDVESVAGARRLARSEAFLAGASGGAVAAALEQLLPEVEDGATIAAIFHDGGVPYLDTIYNDTWVEQTLGISPEELQQKVNHA